MAYLESVKSVNSRRRWLLGLGLPFAGGLGVLAYLQSSRLPATAGTGALPLVMHAQPLPLPQLQVLDGGGRPVELASLKGKVVLLNIWATWCPPCRQEMPSLDRLQSLLGGADFQVVALSVDAGTKGMDLVKSFYASSGITQLAIYQDADATAVFNLKVVGVPSTLLLDRQGREIGRMSGTAEWDAPKIVDALRALMRAGPA